MLDFGITALLVGAMATAFMDASGFALQRYAGIAAPNYALVGRWFGHMSRGRFRHAGIAAAAAIPGERALGWIAHYAIGVAFAAVLLSVWGLGWIRQPTLLPALTVGIGSVAAPYLVMQPAMGAGLASRRTPKPAVARLRSLLNHALFAMGLYAGAWAVHVLRPV